MITTQRILLAVGLLGVAACGADPRHVPFGLQADRFDNAEWSEPVNLGPVVNSSALDANAGLSPDGLTLYFVSARTGGLGDNDIWMSHRQCVPRGSPPSPSHRARTVGVTSRYRSTAPRSRVHPR